MIFYRGYQQPRFIQYCFLFSFLKRGWNLILRGCAMANLRGGKKKNSKSNHYTFFVHKNEMFYLKSSPPTLACHKKENVCCSATEILVLPTDNHIFQKLQTKKNMIYTLFDHMYFIFFQSLSYLKRVNLNTSKYLCFAFPR